MSMNLTAKYAAKYRLVSKVCRESAAGQFEAAIMPMIPRNPETLPPQDEAAGLLNQPSGVWCTTIANEEDGVKGGNTHRATVDRACEMITFKPHSIRFALASEIEESLKNEQLRLDSRVDGARRLSVREDSAFGKRA